MLALKRLKSAHNNFRFSVFGYLREHEADRSINIPMMIKYVCLNFYLLEEKFTKHGTHMVVNNLKNKAEIIFEPNNNTPSIIHGESANTVYGDDVINFADESISEYKWKFKITGDLSHSFSVGIDSSNKKWINDDFSSTFFNKSKFYAWDIDTSVGDVMSYHHGDTKRTVINKYAEDEHHTVDMVLTLNMRDTSLHFEFDQQEMQSYKNISLDARQYYIAVCMCIPNQEISLQEFSIKQSD